MIGSTNKIGKQTKREDPRPFPNASNDGGATREEMPTHLWSREQGEERRGPESLRQSRRGPQGALSD